MLICVVILYRIEVKLMVTSIRNIKHHQQIVLYLVIPKYGLLAQLVRALPCHGRGRRFESGTGRKINP